MVRLPQSPRGREARTSARRAIFLTTSVVPLAPQRQLDARYQHLAHDGAKGKTRTLNVPAAAPLRSRASSWRIGVGVHRRGQPLQAVAEDGRVREQPGLHACCNVENKLGLGHLALWRLVYSATARLRLPGAPASLGQSAVRSWQYRQTGPVFGAGTSRAPSRAARARSSVHAGGGTSAATSAQTRTSRATSPPSWSASSRGLSWDRRCSLHHYHLGLGHRHRHSHSHSLVLYHAACSRAPQLAVYTSRPCTIRVLGALARPVADAAQLL